MVPHPHVSDRFSGSSHLLIVVLVAALAAVFPVSMSVHQPAASSTATSAVPSLVPSASHPLGHHGSRPLSPVVTRQSLARAYTTSRHVGTGHTRSEPARSRTSQVELVAKKTVAPVSSPTTATRAAPAAPAVLTEAETSGYGCAAAIAYLQKHAAPGFTFECPGYALGHQAMTCINVSGVCAGVKLIAISVPCPAAYMNEASNSWVLTGQSDAPIDPYGYCPS